jgi:hypothetical protein
MPHFHTGLSLLNGLVRNEVSDFTYIFYAFPIYSYVMRALVSANLTLPHIMSDLMTSNLEASR